jgi:hypothetical protein
MGKQRENNGINMEYCLELENMETMGKQWENNATKYDSYTTVGKQWDNNGTEHGSEHGSHIDIFVPKTESEQWKNNGKTMK